MSENWYSIKNVNEVDSPSLLIYLDRVKENIKILKSFVKNDLSKLRPHVKTHKSAEITRIMIKEGVTKFKCATIAEAEMLAMASAKDILLAYQPVGPKAKRLLDLVVKYPSSSFSCLIDNLDSATDLSKVFQNESLSVQVYIDLNVGMNRTGILPELALNLWKQVSSLQGITLIGLHAYDGHLRDPDISIRTKQCDEVFQSIEALRKEIENETGKTITLIAGGTPTFPIHAKRKDVECSPGTFIYWDKGYQSILAEQPFLFAALVITRIVSKPNNETICVDLGHKSIASENNLDKRVYFLNAPDVTPTGHSEEHLILKVPQNNSYKVGDVLYGVPYHICPTVALHDRVHVVEDQTVVEEWQTISRNRKITL